MVALQQVDWCGATKRGHTNNICLRNPVIGLCFLSCNFVTTGTDLIKFNVY